MEDLINIVKPSVFLLGKEFGEERRNEIQKYIDLVTENDGKVMFSSGDAHYARVEFLYHDYKEIENIVDPINETMC